MEKERGEIQDAESKRNLAPFLEGEGTIAVRVVAIRGKTGMEPDRIVISRNVTTKCSRERVQKKTFRLDRRFFPTSRRRSFLTEAREGAAAERKFLENLESCRRKGQRGATVIVSDPTR